MQKVPSTDDRRPGNQSYVIQVPKDQIYHVPPPENAKKMEEYRQPNNEEKDRRRNQGLIWCGSIMLFLVFLITTITCVNKYTLNPKLPTFSINGIKLVETSKKSCFKVTVQTTNPNKNNDIAFKEGNATLEYEDEEIGTGKFMGGKHDRGSSDVDVVIVNAVDYLPPEVETRTAKPKGKKNSEDSLVLQVNINTQVKLITWRWTKKVNIMVGCDVEVDSVGKGSSVLSQNCAVDESKR